MNPVVQAEVILEDGTATGQGDRQALWRYYGLAFGITWGVGGLSLLAATHFPRFVLSRSNPLLYVASCGPSIAGVMMVIRVAGPSGLKRLLARVLPTWSSVPWYLAVVAGFVVARLMIGRALDPRFFASLPPWQHLLYLLPLTLVTDPGPLGEEFGWRGFALPNLLRRRPPLAAAIILGAVWALWHLPAFFIPTLSQSSLSFPVFILNSISLSVIMTWLYLRTRGDIFLMVLVHLMANYPGLRIPFNAEVAAEVVCAVAIVIAGGLRQSAHPASVRE